MHHPTSDVGDRELVVGQLRNLIYFFLKNIFTMVGLTMMGRLV